MAVLRDLGGARLVGTGHLGNALRALQPLLYISDAGLELRITRLERLALDENLLAGLVRVGVLQDHVGLAGLSGHALALLEVLLRNEVEPDDQRDEHKCEPPEDGLPAVLDAPAPDTCCKVVVGLGLGGAALSSHAHQLPLLEGLFPCGWLASEGAVLHPSGCGFPHHGNPLLEAHSAGFLAHAQDARGDTGHDGVRRSVAGDHGVRADHGVVAHRHATQNARAVADPDVVSHSDVALVDALEADRAVHLHHSVVEVDQHHAVGDHALAADRDMLERGDRALLAKNGLGADGDGALVTADLASMPDPGPSTQLEGGSRTYLEAASGPHECGAVEQQPPAQAQLPEPEPRDQAPVLEVQHAVTAHEAQQREQAAVARRRRASELRELRGRRGDWLCGALHAGEDHRCGYPYWKNGPAASQLHLQ